MSIGNKRSQNRLSTEQLQNLEYNNQANSSQKFKNPFNNNISDYRNNQELTPQIADNRRYLGLKDKNTLKIAKHSSSSMSNYGDSDFMIRRRQNLSQSQQGKSPLTQQIKKNIGQYITNKRNESLNPQESKEQGKQAYFNSLSKYNQILNPVQYSKFYQYISSTSFQKIIKEKQHDLKSIQNLIKDILGIAITQEDLSVIINYHRNSLDMFASPIREPQQINSLQNSISKERSPAGYPLTSSLQDLPKLNSYSIQKQQESHDYFSPSNKSRFSEKSISTSFSRPFTSLSFVSSTTLGTSLTQKIERLNKQTIKTVAKQLIASQKQIESVLKNNNVNMKTLLTVPEIVLYLQNTDMNMTLTQLQSVLVAVLFMQQPAKPDILLSFKSILKGCQNFLDQSDIEHKDFFNKSKMDRVLDEIRDHIYAKTGQDFKGMWLKATETDTSSADNFDKVVMTLEHFTKFIRGIVGDKHSTREIEQIYRNLVSQKLFTFKKFVKTFKHKNVEEVWFTIGLKQLREYIMKKKSTSSNAFERLLTLCGQKESGKINRLQFRDVMKRENLPFTIPQIDFLFNKFDANNDGFIDLSEWTQYIQDDHLNPLQLIRDVVVEYGLTPDDILHRLKKKLNDEPLNFNQFKECMNKLDSSLTPLQVKNLHELLKNQEGKVEVHYLISNLTGEVTSTANFKRDITKKIQEFIAQKDLHQYVKDQFERMDFNNDGRIQPDQLLVVLKSMNMPIQSNQLEGYIRQLQKDTKGRVNYQSLLAQYENTKNNFPLKAIGMRLVVFLKQNNLSSKSLIEKLIQTKMSSKSNKERFKNSEKQNERDKISANFFAKFIKAKVDKKRPIDEIKQLVMTGIDLDKDGKIGENDLDAFIGRVNFHDFFENQSASKPGSTEKSTLFSANKSSRAGGIGKEMGRHSIMQARTMSFLTAAESFINQSQGSKMFPINSLKGDKLIAVLDRFKEGMKLKNMNIKEAFELMDINHVGLLSFQVFQDQIDFFGQFSHSVKEKLFSKLDTLKIGMVSLDQFKNLLNKSNILLREESPDPREKIEDSFDWQQNIIATIKNWIREKILSGSEAFKIIDSDFDGNISIGDLKRFIKEVIKIPDSDISEPRLERLHKILDISKSGKIFQSDFESVFSVSLFSRLSHQSMISSTSEYQLSNQTKNSRLSGEMTVEQVFNWQNACIYQIGSYLQKNYTTLEDSFDSFIKVHMAEEDPKIRLSDFMAYINTNNVLQGFNLTQHLLQKLFAAMDPHKKGYLTMNDWKLLYSNGYLSNCIIGNFNEKGANIVDIQSAISSSFNSTDEAYRFMLKQSKSSDETSDHITFNGFYSTVQQLLPGRFDKLQIKTAFDKLTKTSRINNDQFKQIFGMLQYRNQTQLHDSLAKQLARSHSQYTRSVASGGSGFKLESQYSNLEQILQSQSRESSAIRSGQSDIALFSQAPLDQITSSKIQSNFIIDKLRRNLKTKGLKLENLCGTDNKSNVIEFRNMLKKLNINAKEIDKLFEMVVYKDDGFIDLSVFISKIRRLEEEEELLDKRNTQRIDILKKMMYSQMTSPEDAFRYFDTQKKGRLTYQEFQQLIQHLYKEQEQQRNLPNYPIIKDLFDQIDIRKDGIIDFNEWTKTFLSDKISSSIQRSNLLVNDSNGQWVTSKDYVQLLTLLSKNRKSMDSMFTKLQDSEGLVKFDLGKIAFSQFIQIDIKHGLIDDWKIEALLKPFQEMKHGEIILNYKKMLETFKNRQNIANAFPTTNILK